MNTKKPPLESKVVKHILEQLRPRGGFWIKIHGSPFQIAGIPDILGCYEGRFIAFEVKRDSMGRPTKLQVFQMNQIRRAGGVARLIWTAEQALELLDRIDERRRPRSQS